MFTEKTRAAKDYSQGNRRRQGKIAKKAGKMRVFLEEMWKSPLKMRLGASHSIGFRMRRSS